MKLPKNAFFSKYKGRNIYCCQLKFMLLGELFYKRFLAFQSYYEYTPSWLQDCCDPEALLWHLNQRRYLKDAWQSYVSKHEGFSFQAFLFQYSKKILQPD